MHFTKEKSNSKSGQKQRNKISEDLEEARNILKNLERTTYKHNVDQKEGPNEERRKLNFVDQIFGTIFCDKEVQAEFQLDEKSVAEYERRIAVLQSDLDKARIDTIKANKDKKKLQEKLSKLGGENNTSSSFMLPSEFKTKWEFLVKDQIPSFLIDFCENPYIYSALTNLLLLVTSQAALAEIDSKHVQMVKLFGLEKKNSAEEVMKYMRRFYQDYSNEIFFLQKKAPLIQIILEEFKKKAEGLIKHFFSNQRALLVGETIEETFVEYLNNMLDSNDCKSALPTLYNLFIHFHLSEAPLTLYPDLCQNVENWQPIFAICKKTEVLCMEGFLKEDSIGCIVVPGINRNRTSFLAIKPGVIVLPEELVNQAIRDKALDLKKTSKTENQQKPGEAPEKEESLTNQSVSEEPDTQGDSEAQRQPQNSAVSDDPGVVSKAEELPGTSGMNLNVTKPIELSKMPNLVLGCSTGFEKKPEEDTKLLLPTTSALNTSKQDIGSISTAYPRANSLSTTVTGYYNHEDSTKTPEREERTNQIFILNDLHKVLYSSLKKPQRTIANHESRRTPTKEREQYSQSLSNNTNVSNSYSPFERSQNGTGISDKEIFNLLRESNKKIVGESNLYSKGSHCYEQQQNTFSASKRGTANHQQKILATTLNNNYIAQTDNRFNYAQFFRSYNQIKDFAGELKRSSVHEKGDLSNDKDKSKWATNACKGEYKGRDAEGYEIYYEGNKIEGHEKPIANVKCETERVGIGTAQNKKKNQIVEDKVEIKRLELSEAISSLKKSIELLKSSKNTDVTSKRHESSRKDPKSSEINIASSHSSDPRGHGSRVEPDKSKKRKEIYGSSITHTKQKINSFGENSLKLDEIKINSFLQNVITKNIKVTDNSSSLHSKGF